MISCNLREIHEGKMHLLLCNLDNVILKYSGPLSDVYWCLQLIVGGLLHPQVQD